MGMTIATTAEPQFLRVITGGDFSLEEAERTFLEVLGVIAVHRAAKVLFDGREVSGEPTTIQRFYYGDFAARAVARYARESGNPAPQFAYVLVEPVLDPARFGETVAVNRGMNIKAFDNLPQALDWLEVTG